MDLKSNEPFWLIKNGILHSYASLRDDCTCDIVIIGGGITGSLLAHQCLEDGYDTIVLDRREVGNGSTSATTSMLQYEIDTPLYQLMEMIGKKGALASYQACADAIDHLDALTRQIKSKAGFEKKKSLYFAARRKDIQWLKKEYDTRLEAGYQVAWLEAAQIQSQYDLQTPYGGILSTKGGSVDAFMLAHELLNYNVKRGLRVFDKTMLNEVSYQKSHVLVKTSTQNTIKASKIIYCNGYESTHLIKEKFVKLLSSYAIISEVDSELYTQYKDILLWNTAEPYLYMRTSDDGRFLMGGEDEPFQNPKKRDALLNRKQKKLERAFQKLFPSKTFRTDFTWAGTFGETKDGLPYIGTHPDFKNSYFVLGFGGNGITFSVTGMEMASYWLAGKKHPLAPYFGFGR